MNLKPEQLYTYKTRFPVRRTQTTSMINDVEYFKATSESETAIAFESFENWLSTIENIPEAEGEIYQGAAQLLQSNFINMADIAEAYLVFDRNGNGTIDDATELFSDYTPLYAGGRASNGFVALAQEDTNQDGVVNHLDTNCDNLKIWQDMNSDGISQSGKLLALAGIKALAA